MNRFFWSPLIVAFALPAGAVEQAPGTVLAKRGDVVVTVEDLEASFSTVPEEQRAAFRASNEKLMKAAHTLFVNRMLAKSARDSGLDQKPEFRKRMQLLEESLLAQEYIEAFTNGVKKPDFEAKARELYLADSNKYTAPERVKVRTIFVPRKGRTADEAMARAREARQRLLSNENFFVVAKDFSTDPGAQTHRNEIGPVPYDKVPQEIRATAQTLAKGQVSEVIESSAGYHIVIVAGRWPAEKVPFEQAKAEIIAAEEKKFVRDQIDRKLSEFLDKETVFYLDNIEAERRDVDREKLRQIHKDAAAEWKKQRE